MSEDIDLLQGVWRIQSISVGGEPMPFSLLETATLQVNGDRFVSLGMGAEYEGTIKIDASREPRHLDMKFDVGPEAGNVNPCIYKIEGDRWKLCIATTGFVRPTSFESKPGSGFVVEVLQRSAAARAEGQSGD
jgi:uncharacterized protein (TIGR03067 family)